MFRAGLLLIIRRY